MIQVSQEQLNQVEYLIGQSIQGNHVLFDPEQVKSILLRGTRRDVDPEEFDVEAAYAAERHIEKLMEQPTLWQKRLYLERLDTETYERVVRTYFHIVENSLYESQEERH